MSEKNELELDNENVVDEEGFSFTDEDFDALIESRHKETTPSQYVPYTQPSGKYTNEEDFDKAVSKKVKELLEEKDKVAPSEATLQKIGQIIGSIPENETITREFKEMLMSSIVVLQKEGVPAQLTSVLEDLKEIKRKQEEFETYTKRIDKTVTDFTAHINARNSFKKALEKSKTFKTAGLKVTEEIVEFGMDLANEWYEKDADFRLELNRIINNQSRTVKQRNDEYASLIKEKYEDYLKKKLKKGVSKAKIQNEASEAMAKKEEEAETEAKETVKKPSLDDITKNWEKNMSSGMYRGSSY